MKKNLTFKILGIVSLVLAFLNASLFYAMRCCWSGLSKTLGYENNYSGFLFALPIIILVILVLVLAANITLYFLLKENKIWKIVFCAVNTIFLIANMVIVYMGAMDYMYFIIPEFFKTIGIIFLIFVGVFFIFYYPKLPIKDSKLFKGILLTIIILIPSMFAFNMFINTFTYEAVVYAVEDKYQIVFSTSQDSLGWVEINGTKYDDTFAGSEKSFTKVHKVEVPMDVLNNSKSYTIFTQKLIYRGPFGAYKGSTKSIKYNFRPVNGSDGLNYYAFSDIHMAEKQAIKTAKYDSDKEFLVLSGDIISYVNSFNDAQFINDVAFELTKGEIPVIYVRGNHEVKGKYAEQLYKFVGSKNQKFYYNVYLDNVYVTVLDTGEDNPDDYWEYYGTANFDAYRNEQVEFIKNEVEKKKFDSFKYRLLISHIPLVYVHASKIHEEFKRELEPLLNQMNIDMYLSGHLHKLYVYEPNVVEPYKKLTFNEAYGGGKYNGYLTDFNFPSLTISKRGYTQIDKVKFLQGSPHIGLTIKVDFEKGIQTAIYNNAKQEQLNMVNPFANINYGNEIEISLTTKKFKAVG